MNQNDNNISRLIKLKKGWSDWIKEKAKLKLTIFYIWDTSKIQETKCCKLKDTII